MNAKDFNPTTEMFDAAQTLLQAMAYMETIRPIVEGYEKEILDDMQPLDRYEGELITDIKYTYMMPDDIFKIYDRRCRKARDKAGLHVDNDGFCPLLVADTFVVDATRTLIEVVEPVFKVSHHALLCSGMDKFHEYVELMLKLLVSHPKSTIAA